MRTRIHTFHARATASWFAYELCSGATVLALAVLTQWPFAEAFKPLLSLALEHCFSAPPRDVVAALSVRVDE